MTLVYESMNDDGTTEICIAQLGGNRWLNEVAQEELVGWIVKHRPELLQKLGWCRK